MALPDMFGAVGNAVGDVVTELTSFTKFQQRVDEPLHDLRTSPAGARHVGKEPAARHQFGGDAGAWADAAGLFDAYRTVISELESLSKLLSDSIEAMGIAALASHKGYQNVDVDIRDRMARIYAETSHHYGAHHQGKQPYGNDPYGRYDGSTGTGGGRYGRRWWRERSAGPYGCRPDVHVRHGRAQGRRRGRCHLMSHGSGSGDPFGNMSHQQTLHWLDQPDGDAVQPAADRLSAAAKEIHKIAQDLRTRPRHVSWNGEGAEAFRSWSAGLANSALRWGDFSAGSAEWLAQASDAIARAQVSVPREMPGGKAPSTRQTSGSEHTGPANDAGISNADLAKLAADREAVRQETATEMRKLGRTYELAATQMNDLERPVSPPPRDAVVPDTEGISDRKGLARSGVTSVTEATILRRAQSGHGSVSDILEAGRSTAASSFDRQPVVSQPSVGTSIDSVGTPPRTLPAHGSEDVPGPSTGQDDVGVPSAPDPGPADVYPLPDFPVAASASQSVSASPGARPLGRSA